MDVILRQGKHSIMAIYDIDPVDLIVAARQGDYGVSIMGDSPQSYQILIEASQVERAAFRALNGGCHVWRTFVTPRDVVLNLMHCMPQVYQDAQTPGATFSVETGQSSQVDVPYTQLSKMQTCRNLHDYLRLLYDR